MLAVRTAIQGNCTRCSKFQNLESAQLHRWAFHEANRPGT
jgi:hypothetical protein